VADALQAVHEPPADAPWSSWTLRRAGTDGCWGTLAAPPHRHLTVYPAELLLLPIAAAAPPAITVVAPHPRVRRAALPAAALPPLLAGWLVDSAAPAPPHPPVLFLLRMNSTRPLRQAEGARWEAFGRALRERGDALLVTLPAPEAHRS
jgi:hypothetical protein